MSFWCSTHSTSVFDRLCCCCRPAVAGAKKHPGTQKAQAQGKPVPGRCCELHTCLVFCQPFSLPIPIPIPISPVIKPEAPTNRFCLRNLPPSLDKPTKTDRLPHQHQQQQHHQQHNHLTCPTHLRPAFRIAFASTCIQFFSRRRQRAQPVETDIVFLLEGIQSALELCSFNPTERLQCSLPPIPRRPIAPALISDPKSRSFVCGTSKRQNERAVVTAPRLSSPTRKQPPLSLSWQYVFASLSCACRRKKIDKKRVRIMRQGASAACPG